MKRCFLSFLVMALPGADLWRMPAWAQLTTLGVGGIAAVVVGAYAANDSRDLAAAEHIFQSERTQRLRELCPQDKNNGTIGAEELPTTPANSHVMYISRGFHPTLSRE